MRTKHILRNTLALYSRQLIIVFINLYALRVVLIALGVEGFGIYSVVAGFVTLLSFLPGSMAMATQRFFSFALGQQDDEKLKQTFSVNWVLYACMAMLAFVILQTLGLWFVGEQLSLPEGRAQEAHSLYKFVVLSFVTSVFSSPFIAILIAHEDMHLYAMISVIEAILKLVAAVALTYTTGDALEVYGQFLLVVALVTTASYIGVCLPRYVECQFRKIYWNKNLLSEIVAFTSWTLIGQISTVFRNQAVTILLNQLFNPATVAARAIAVMVSQQALVFSRHLNTGLYPPIIKSYAANQKKEMFSLVFNGSKLTFFLMWILALPLLLEMDAILKVWLKTPPPEAVVFTQLALIESLILSFSLPLATAARAPGKMRLYELTLGSIQIAIFVASWLVLKAGYPAHSVFVVAIIANILMFQIRLSLVNFLIQLPVVLYYIKVLVPIALVAVLSTLPGTALRILLPDEGFIYSLMVILASFVSAIVFTFYLGLDKRWRGATIDYVRHRVFKQQVGV